MTARPPGTIKVVRVIARLNVGGPARHVLLLNEALTRQGYDTLLVHGSIGPGEASFEHVAAQLGLRTRKISTLGRRIHAISDVVALGALVRLLFAESPDLVHTHTAKAGALGRVAAALYNLTRSRARRSVVVHTFHGHVLAGYFTNIGSRLVRLAERVLATMTDCVIAISPSQQRELVGTFRIATREQTVMIPLGLDLAAFPAAVSSADARRGLGLAEDAFVIGYVGRFVPIKDLDTLMQAFAIVARQLPEAALVMAGGGPTRRRLETLAEELNVRQRVTFTGWTDDLPPLYAATDICCLSSLNEGTPVAMIEAMAAQRAVVATRVGGVVDLIEDGRTGVLVPPGDPGALAQAILRLAADPQRRRLMGEAAREAVIPQFSVERLAHDIDETYRMALQKKREGRAVAAA